MRAQTLVRPSGSLTRRRSKSPSAGNPRPPQRKAAVARHSPPYQAPPREAGPRTRHQLTDPAAQAVAPPRHAAPAVALACPGPQSITPRPRRPPLRGEDATEHHPTNPRPKTPLGETVPVPKKSKARDLDQGKKGRLTGPDPAPRPRWSGHTAEYYSARAGGLVGGLSDTAAARAGCDTRDGRASGR